ncbi:endonuclease/exonuclease/phosphatase family protein [Edaphobacter sp. HDX4]|uniref:endonuclease/exonuclease/phosphatase family protein n=1 Tax=Edaphobacter sp. HDX4 TaxID=2794064 RepID=UPI002FE52E65
MPEPPCQLDRETTAMVSACAAEAVRHRTFCAVSLNLAKESCSDKVMNAIRAGPHLRDADIFLFQEVSRDSGKAGVAEEVAGRLGFHVYFADAPEIADQGLAIVSRFPILERKTERLRSFDLRFRSRKRFAIAATVQTTWAEVRIWNLHLDTRINVQQRLEQLQPVLEGAARHAGPQLIGGDFNTNDLYWLRNVLPVPSRHAHIPAVRVAMRQHGFESPLPDELITCPRIRRHLDWLFVRGLKSLEAGAEPVPFSDHRAVWICAQI